MAGQKGQEAYMHCAGKSIAQQTEHECFAGLQVLNKVQLNNLHALAPGGASAELSLCREVAASRNPPNGAAATKTAPTSAKELTPVGNQIQVCASCFQQP